jgi:hypothetical protein
MRSPAIQTAVAKKFIENLSKKLNTTITVGKLRYGFNNNLIIRDLYIADQQNDTLFFASRIEAQIKTFNLNSKTIELKTLEFKKCKGNLVQFVDSSYNFSFISKAFQKNESQSFDWHLSVQKINITKTDLLYKGLGLSANNSQISLGIEHFVVDSSFIGFDLNHFSNNINNHSFLRNVSFNFEKNRDNIQLNNFKAITLNSFLQFDRFVFKQKNEKPLVLFQGLSSRIFLHDFRSLIPKLLNRREFITCSGALEKYDNYIQGKNFRIQLGKSSMIQSSFLITDYKLHKQLAYQLDIDELFTNADDINYIVNNYLNKKPLELPEILNNLGNITYLGKLNGDASMLISKGNITSNIGKISSNIKVSRDDTSKNIYVDGTIDAKPIYLNTLIESQSIGEIAFTLNTKGFFSKTTGPHLNLDGFFHHFYVNKNRIDSIKIKGNLDNDLFEGRISSFDEKLRFDLDGLFSFDTIPMYNFNLILYNANLKKLGLNKRDSIASLSLNMKANFTGNTFNNTTGDIGITDLYYFKDTSYFATDSITISSKNMDTGKQFILKSEYLHAELQGNYNTLTLKRSIESLIHHHIPTLGIKPTKPDTLNNFKFTVIADYPHPITEMLFPEFRISSGTSVTGNFNAIDNTLSVTCYSDRFEFYNKEISDINLKAYTRNNSIYLNIDSKEFRYTEKASLKNFMSSVKIHNDSININFNWNNWLANSYSGNLNTLLTFSPNKHTKKPDLKFDLYPSNIVVIDTIWYISKGYVEKDSNSFTFSNLKIDNGSSRWSVNGKLSNNPKDSIVFDVENMSMTHLNVLLKKDNIQFNGNLSGKTSIKDIYGEKRITSDLFIEDFTLNGETIGETKITSAWNNDKKQLQVLLLAQDNGINTIRAEGAIIPQDKELDLMVELNNQPFALLEPFLKPNLVDFKGVASGKARLYGTVRNPKWEGKIFANQVGLKVAATNVNYQFTDSVTLKERNIIFKEITVSDLEQNTAKLSGVVSHSRFENYKVEATLSTQKILGLKTSMANNPLYYGTVYGSGDVNLKFVNNVFDLRIVATTLNNSYFYVPLEGKTDIKENDFIEFVNHAIEKKQTKNKASIPFKPTAKLNFYLDLKVTPDAEVQIIFDPEIGDVLTANGFAQLNIESINGGFEMYGDYNINKGEFMFTLQNVINKKLDIQPNSSVSWTGDPLDAIINLDAIYKIRKASVYDLTQDLNDKEKRVEVDCHLKMTDKLINPTIKFAVQVPSSTNVTAIDQLNSLPEDELNKQVLSLLLINKFTPLYQQTNTGSSSKNLGTTTVSELLSNQLSSWLSQINSAFDLGFVYRPGDENTQQEYEIALSTDLWNDRISLNGNVGYSTQLQTTEKSPYTTDFQIELKLNKKGNIRLRAFQKVNNDIEYSQAPYTQGFGIFYTEEFDTFNQLLQKIFRDEYATKPPDIEIETIHEDSLP